MYTEYGCFQHWYNTTFSMCFVDIHIINLTVCTLFMRGISRILYRTCMHLCLQQRLFWSSMMVKSHWPLIYMISIYNQQSSMSCCDMHPPTLAFVYEAQIKLWGWHGNTAPYSSQMLFICSLYMNMKHMVRKDYMTTRHHALHTYRSLVHHIINMKHMVQRTRTKQALTVTYTPSCWL